jgi:hypothetical protein
MGARALLGLGLWKSGRGRSNMKEKTGMESAMMMNDVMRDAYMWLKMYCYFRCNW